MWNQFLYKAGGKELDGNISFTEITSKPLDKFLHIGLGKKIFPVINLSFITMLYSTYQSISIVSMNRFKVFSFHIESCDAFIFIQFHSNFAHNIFTKLGLLYALSVTNFSSERFSRGKISQLECSSASWINSSSQTNSL